MHQPTSEPGERLAALATHLDGRREVILETWHRAADEDPVLTTGPSLPYAQFRDHIPHLLNTFARTLRTRATDATAPAASGQWVAVAHGLQRWQQGYRLREVTRELGLLHSCVADELEAYTLANPAVEPGVMAVARRAWAELCWRSIGESTEEYHRLQQAEAAGHARDLALALDEVRDTERRRAEAWREAAHDLRGNVGVVKTTTSILGVKGVPESAREKAVDMLQRNVAALQAMLDELLSLARLEAGHERRDAKPFDAAELLSGLCANLQPMAIERGLYLNVTGPTTLPVVGDAAKVGRVAQNLLINALKYTARGGVTVTWAEGSAGDEARWLFVVADTGPGIHVGPAAAIAEAVKEATTAAKDASRPPDTGATEPTPAAQAGRAQPGEGIGLSIVKRLCELLDATLELESKAGEGSTFRVRMPRRYDAAPGA
ncbi:sensor histidine kinase [Fimbriiglobus ruber]|uniref:histidine kinase n=1 Tax=Fimbriiglobus ruber TaxID=1908690 RepID=A0A225DZ40_9BACT|nr:HAMP domain-containing sensor histidine kinase [Fimbriiglobus ruber]OWK41615.1 two-component hybrid sensor and regulator [Fimbriiglobus ruber]